MDNQGLCPSIDSPLLHAAGSALPISIKGAELPWRTPEETLTRSIANIAGFPITGETEEEKVYFVGYNAFNEKLCEWIYSGLTKQVDYNNSDIPMSVEIPSAQVELRENLSAKKVG